MSKDHHENILQESLQKLEEEEEVEEEEQQQQQQQQQEEEEKQKQKGGVEKDGVKEGGVASREGVEEGEGCRTPTSSDHKIPIIQSCPPTPKKKVRASFVHKRKSSELQFFETTRSEEVESFFRSTSAEPFTVESSRSFKRRCRSA